MSCDASLLQQRKTIESRQGTWLNLSHHVSRSVRGMDGTMTHVFLSGYKGMHVA